MPWLIIAVLAFMLARKEKLVGRGRVGAAQVMTHWYATSDARDVDEYRFANAVDKLRSEGVTIAGFAPMVTCSFFGAVWAMIHDYDENEGKRAAVRVSIIDAGNNDLANLWALIDPLVKKAIG